MKKLNNSARKKTSTTLPKEDNEKGGKKVSR